MRKMFLLSFMLIAVAFVSCEKMYEDEPYEPMAEDSINEEVANQFGVVELSEEQAREIVEDYLDGINVNFSTGELKVIESLTGLNHFRFEVYYKKVWVDNSITLHPMRDHETNEFSTTQVLITGASLFYNDISVKPRLSKKEALKCLKQSDSAITDEVIESQPELLIHKDRGEAPYLAYKIRVNISTFDCWDYYVSAQTGEVLDRTYKGAVS
ncbi:MAG: PepSY domain-containing protein [Paludibacteraceae bacterium]|nr:PepSY domain-containing protein [Paludibacteraceae bacterium]